MTMAIQGTLMIAVGFVAARLVLTGAYLNYLKESMGVWLLAAGAILVAVGLAALVRFSLGRSLPAHDHPMTRAAWLLLAPAMAVIMIPTDPLGSFAADRRDIRQPDTVLRPDFGPLPGPADGTVELGLREFVDRAFLDEERSLSDRRVRLTGFVAPAADGASFTLSRFVILCCAADAYPVEVSVIAADAPPPIDSWVTVTGRWRQPPGKVRPYVDLIEMEAESIRRILRPENPYDPA